MGSRTFYAASDGAIDQVTSLFRFVWPTAAALWNLRWQVAGFAAARPVGYEQELQHRFVLGSGIHGADLKTACLTHSWEEQQREFSAFILVQACALYEAWLERVLESLKLNSRSNLKGLQFPHETKSGKQTGYSVVLAKIQAPNAIGAVFRPALLQNRKNALGAIQALLQCYRFFKECRNDLAHGGGLASDKTVGAYAGFSPLTNTDLALPEKPKVTAPVLGEPLLLTLRGVVGFTDVVLRLIATFDAELAMCAHAADEVANRWRAYYGNRIQLKAEASAQARQVARCVQKLGLPEPSSTAPLTALLRERRLVRW